jgi:hypothetical protein
MEGIFKIEFHPVNKPPQRIRFLLEARSDRIVRVTEEKRDGHWNEIDSEIVSYLEYSDEERATH